MAAFLFISHYAHVDTLVREENHTHSLYIFLNLFGGLIINVLVK